MRRLDTSAVQTLQFAKNVLLLLYFRIAVCSRCQQQWFKLHGIVISRYLRYFSRYRGTAIHRDLGDIGIVTFGITILTEASQVSHNTSRKGPQTIKRHVSNLQKREATTARVTTRLYVKIFYAVIH